MIHFVIPARCEYPQLVWTVYSVVNDMPDKHFHIHVISNGGDEETDKMDEWFRGGSLAKKGFLTVETVKEPVNSYATIQRISESLDDGVLMFSCAHISVTHGTIPKLARLAEETSGYVHSPMLYLGDYHQGDGDGKLYGYKDELKRGWSWKKISDEPYMWMGGGGALSAVPLKTWRDVGGADAPFRKGIGGSEQFLDMKMWMFNKSVWIHPGCLYYHWAKNRGYTWRMHEHYWNDLVATYCLAGREAMEKQNESFTYPQTWEFLEEVEKLSQPHRKFILDNASYTLEEVLEKKPWEVNLRRGENHDFLKG